MSVRNRVANVRDMVRTQLWPAPVVGVVVAVVAGVLLPELDRAIDGSLSDSVTGYLFGGGASAARTVLDAVASSLITVTSLTFSLTVVTLQLASGQFSPRLLRTFTKDRFVHVTLALFLATFVYALTVLRTVRSAIDEQVQFVPQISVTLAFVLALASVVALVLFLAHLAREIRVETMVDSVHRDASATVTRLLADDAPSEDRNSVAPARKQPLPPPGASLILAERSGFLTSVDHLALRAAAQKFDVVVLIERPPGMFVVAGTPVGRWWRNGKTGGARKVTEGDGQKAFDDALGSALNIGKERNDTQDFTFGLRQLTDVTSKALSPGINDPTTASHSLGHTSALICEIARHDLRDQLQYGDDEQLRVICRRVDFAQLLDEALTQPRRYGAADPAVMTRLFGLLREVAWSVHSAEQRTAVAEQLERLRGTVAAQDFDDAERAALDSCHRDVQNALEGRWPGHD